MYTIWQRIKEFYDPDISMYASSLSFHTIFSIIPLLLVSFSLFIKLPSFQKHYLKIKEFIFSNLMPTQHETFSNYIDTFLQNSNKLGLIGFAFVLFASLMFFQNYEYIINKIFKTKPRGFWESITIYWTLVTLAPLALALSFYLSAKIQTLLNSSSYTSGINFLALFPYLIIWFLFFIMYKISSSEYVNIKAALISSFISSLIWNIGKALFIYYVFYSKTYTTIYGSFSAILFFFLWIYISWIIFLYGLRLCYMLHNYYQSKEQSTKENKSVQNCKNTQQ
ncbi:YihY/virulence factor BrkB family protein [Nitratiruptor sp. YY09-18]|uniref:YihY/virulence factor BrkB family protein n=1 Tax=Nitratiruptor sp. YY09-18 TaxID=2724901 RepID=UPI0019157AE1|nr:YihY/virulence factor BrkB family protein [Nitratiruptor sp. YY09-18]